MENEHKLIEDVKRLLHTAGFKELLVNTSSQGGALGDSYSPTGLFL